MNHVIRPASGLKETVLKAHADEISIPPGMAQEARDRFSSIAKWMERRPTTDRPGSILADRTLTFMPRGRSSSAR